MTSGGLTNALQKLNATYAGHLNIKEHQVDVFFHHHFMGLECVLAALSPA